MNATRPGQTPKGARPETLDEFSAALDDHLNADVGFADAVRDLWVTRQRLANLESARRETFEHVKTAFHTGTRVVGEFELRETARREPEVYRAVEAAVVKKHAPAAYAAARTLVSRVSVSAPRGSADLVPRDRVPKLPKTVTAEAAVRAYKSDLFSLIKLLKSEEVDLLGRLEKIAAEAGWDGTEQVFADGWKAALKREQFSGERLREIDPDLWDRLAVTKVREQQPRVYLAKRGEVDEAVDLDAE